MNLLFRRTLLAGAPFAMSAASRGPWAGCQTNAWRIDPSDFNQVLAVLRRIRELGYHGFETGFRNVQPRFDRAGETRSALEAHGLKFIGCHIFLLQYDPSTGLAPAELIETVARGAASLGAGMLILSGRGSTEAGRFDGAAAERKIRALGRAGALCRKLGIGLAYHNHDAELKREGQEIETILRRTDPETVQLMLDAGHASRAGADLAQFAALHSDRIAGIHLRDYRDGEQVPLGDGQLDYRPMVKALRRAKWRGWFINEEERLNDGRPGDAAVAPARKALRKISGV